MPLQKKLPDSLIEKLCALGALSTFDRLDRFDRLDIADTFRTYDECLVPLVSEHLAASE